MEENLINNNEPAPVVEKVSLKEVKQEKDIAKAEDDEIVNNLINSALALNEQEIQMAIAFLDKKIEILKKIK